MRPGPTKNDKRSLPPGGTPDLQDATSDPRGKARSARSDRPKRRRRRVRLPGPTFPGSPAGIESTPLVDVPPEPGAVSISCVDYGPDRASAFDVPDLEAFLSRPRPEWSAVRWVNVAGLHPQVINRFRQAYGFHTLAAEDALKVPQRPRVEPYPDFQFIVASMFRQVDGKFTSGQVSVFFYGNMLLTFQEEPDGAEAWSTIRQRIQASGSTLRQGDAGFLLYSILDALIDHIFPVVEHYGDLLETLEDRIIEEPTTALSGELHSVRRKLLELRRMIWPIRLMIHDLQSSDSPNLSSTVRTYLRDVHEHSVQLIDVIETYRDMASGMIELYLSAVSYRMNEVMKVLTIIATIFIPITFLAGVFGMNFKVMPELNWEWGYALFWLICIVTVVGLIRFFRRKGWIGEGQVSK
ncbi:Magnesium and cobalt transport protein CorA [Vulgatibacter incomptus]|uniref:Magnesium transport protein CorA n=1 Tax=Vulgatibacter incomptus TaxID=1391653 RepID=A0A0K1PI00_9BACT|nr:Magnesium and cobalt transport protein CorA [Vulgatibacter incomptus]